MSNSFANIQEEKQSRGVKISTGIHDVKITKVEVATVPGKNGQPDWKKGVVTFEATKTHKGKDSVGKTIAYDILFPNSDEALEKTGKRIMHIFSKISKKDKIEIVKGEIRKLNLTSIDTLMAGLKKMSEGRELRIKVVADKEGKYPMIPLYYAGYAETLDTNPSELQYDEEKEGTKTQPKGAEAPTATPDSVATAGITTDDLPF